MARIFTIYFTYEDLVHHAVVSVRSTPFYTEYTLSNFDEDLLLLLPSNKILSQAPGHFIFHQAGNQNTTALMDTIIKAVSEHIEEKATDLS